MRFECDNDNYGYSVHCEDVPVGGLSVVRCIFCGRRLRRVQ